MSYCRWSSDNWQSDLYCYCADEGFITHIASQRYVHPIPPLARWDSPDFVASMMRERAALVTTPKAAIGLPYDGLWFTDDTLEAFLARLLMLREVGYHVPEHAVQAARGEIEDEKGEQ